MNKILAIIFVFNFVCLNRHVSAYTLDVSGDKGKDGSIEQDYNSSPGANRSSSGKNGTDSSKSKPGEDSSDLNLLLQDVGSSSRAIVEMSGTRIYPSKRKSSIHEKYDLSNSSTVKILANGGDGGDGGHGGDAEGGCNGNPGKNATKNSNSTRGTRGCNGGNAGAGSKASDGGDGGRVVVRVPYDDVHLLRALRIEVEYGEGGDRGKNGAKGRGGNGGPGGRGISWKVKTGTRTIKGRCPKPVDKGDGSFHVPPCEKDTTIDLYETKSRSSSGNGPRGADGSSSSANVSAGSDGTKGKVIYEVIYPNGAVERYSKPFLLSIQSYDLVEAPKNRDGLFEPGETIYLRNLKIKNIGGAPSSIGKGKISTSLSSSSLLVVQDNLEVPQLKSGETYQFKEDIIFKIPHTAKIGTDSPTKILHSLSPSAEIMRMGLTLNEFKQEKRVNAQYPVAIEFFDVPNSRVIAPGEELPVLLKVTNMSSKEIGVLTSRQRAIEAFIEESGGDTPSNFITLMNKSEAEDTLLEQHKRSLGWAIEGLKPGASQLIEAVISLDESAPVYTYFGMQTKLKLQKIDAEGAALIQSLDIKIRVSQKYKFRKDADLLLITDKNTVRSEYMAWKKMADDLGVKMDIWDLSYYGELSLKKQLEGEGADSLLENYKGKTIILTNEESKSRKGNVLSFSDFYSATQEKDINFLFLGGDQEQVKDFLKEKLEEAIVSTETLIPSEKIKRSLWQRIMEPRESALNEQAQVMAERLAKSHPEERFLIYKDLDNNVISAQQTLDQEFGHAYSIAFKSEDLDNPKFIESESMQRAVLLALAFKNKVKLLENNSSFVADAILHDLIREIDHCEFIKSCYLKKLQHLSSLLFSENSKRNIGKIIASLEIYTHVLSRKDLRKKIENLCEEIKAKNSLALIVENEKDRIRSLLKKRKEVLVGITQKNNMRNLFIKPAIHRVQSTENLLNSNAVMEN